MSIITLPSTLYVASMTIGQRRFDVGTLSNETGASQDRLKGPPRWAMNITSPDRIPVADMDVWKAMIVSLRGRVNHLAAWDIGKPAPRGTMRGTMTLSGSHAQGATSLTITAGVGQASTTLKAGDWLQIGSGLTSQLVMVMADATANGSGVITVTVEAPLRLAGGYAGGTAVTWDKALGHFKVVSDAGQWKYVAGALLMGGATVDLLEAW